MSDSERSTPREKRYRARHRRILDIAATLAEDEGWEAVTTRRLAEEIDYSQPVIYQHFANRDELVRTLVTEGFVALSAEVDRVARRGVDGDPLLADLCRAYVEFGTARPRRYEAMFSMPTTLRFADAETPPELRHAFDALAQVIRTESPAVTDADVEQSAELFWACCHGLVSLLNAGRIPGDRLEHHIHGICRTIGVRRSS